MAWTSSPTHEKGGRWSGFTWFDQQQPRDEVSFYRSPEWRSLRAKTLQENCAWYGRITCERCGVSRTWRFEWTGWLPTFADRVFHGDHVVPRSIAPGRELDPDNVQVLCDGCNYTKGNRCRFDFRWWRRLPLCIGYPVCWGVRWHQIYSLGWSR
ncbi:MAG: HNH endonuclease [Geminicoccaceae bacterium]